MRLANDLSLSLSLRLSAIRSLIAIGALSPESSSLTSLGRHLAALPVDVRVGKMLVYSAMLGCLDSMSIIAGS